MPQAPRKRPRTGQPTHEHARTFPPRPYRGTAHRVGFLDRLRRLLTLAAPTCPHCARPLTTDTFDVRNFADRLAHGVLCEACHRCDVVTANRPRQVCTTCKRTLRAPDPSDYSEPDGDFLIATIARNPDTYRRNNIAWSGPGWTPDLTNPYQLKQPPYTECDDCRTKQLCPACRTHHGTRDPITPFRGGDDHTRYKLTPHYNDRADESGQLCPACFAKGAQPLHPASDLADSARALLDKKRTDE